MDTRPQMATIATSTVWNNTLVVDRIVAYLPAQDHVKAQRINKVFFDSANRPSMWMRRFGAASLDLACVAAGRFDAFWERNLQAWDVAAGILLVREAGGVVSDLKGRDTMLESGDILATNEHLHRPLLELLRGANS